MKSTLLLIGALLAPAFGCEKTATCNSAAQRVLAAVKTANASAGKTSPSAPAPSRQKPAEKEKDARRAPPAHLFM